MKAAAFVVAALLCAAPAHAQFGGFLEKAQKANDAKKKIEDIHINDKEERQLGENVSKTLVDKYGIYQDPAVTRYVTLVGDVLAQASPRPDLEWKFIVLDTDGVNAFAAPGGIVHVTRGLLGMLKNEAELAGVLGHEITHVTQKHTVHYIEKDKTISAGTDAVGSNGTRDYIIAKLSEKAYHVLLDGEYSQQDEKEADKLGVQLANKVGYDPHGLADALKKVESRNASRDQKNGMFASHPAIKDRIASIEKEIKDLKLAGTATVQARYAQNITFDAKPITDITMVVAGSAGLAGGNDNGKDAKKEDEPKKKGGLLGRVNLTGGQQAKNQQTVASAGSRGGWPDRDSVGGNNKNPVNAKVTPADVAKFKEGIAG